jgi:peptidyl-prolyl cis-trans isomerase B (cyclophilin B)
MDQDNQVFAIVIVILLIIGLIGGGMYYLSQKNSNNQMQNDTTKTDSTGSQLKGDENVTLTNRTVVMETNFGTLHIKMLDTVAPKTTESFIRLTARKYFDNLTFHRMVQIPGFSIIQGGDPRGNGTGGTSAFGKAFADELVKADNPSELIAPELYADSNGTPGTYRKGLLAMANSGPNTNGSQFFIMLGDTRLSPNYTVFGQVAAEDFAILDKIAAEVKPSSSSGDGKPNKEIKIVKATLAE